MLEASALFSEFIEQEVILNFYLMYFCGKVQSSMTPAGATDLTQSDRRTKMTAKYSCLNERKYFLLLVLNLLAFSFIELNYGTG